MINIFFSCFDKREESIYDDLGLLMAEAENYKKVLNVPDILTDDEWKKVEWLRKNYEGVKKFPSYQIFCQQYPDAIDSFVNPPEPIKDIQPNDLRTYIFNFIDFRTNLYISAKMEKLNKTIAEYGITNEISDEINRLENLSNRNKAKDIELTIDGKGNYAALKMRPKGMSTGIQAIDSRIGGMTEGTLTVIAGFTSQFKSTFALNIAHLNAYYKGYNIAYITLETPKQDMYWNMLSRHSYLSKFSKYPFIGHDKMRKAELTADEEDYLFNTIEPDLTADEELDDGSTVPRGRVVFLDESDFKYFSMGEIQQTLTRVDEQLDGKLDAVIVDYIQLCKFAGSGINYSEVSTVNAYTSFFRRLSQNFRRVRDKNGKENIKQLTVIILSQIRRDAWRRAVNHNGVYDVTCMSDSSELEKSAFRIFTTFTTEELKERKVAQVQILKNRTGMTMQADPAEVFANGEASVFCDEDGIDVNAFAGNDQTDALSASFAGIGSGSLASLL